MPKPPLMHMDNGGWAGWIKAAYGQRRVGRRGWGSNLKTEGEWEGLGQKANNEGWAGETGAANGQHMVGVRG